MNKYIRKFIKVFLWILTSLILLVVLLAVALNIPYIQNIVKDKALTYLQKKTHTEIQLKSIKIGFPKNIVLKEFYIQDLKGDTLLYTNSLVVDISLFKLLKNQVEINNIELENVRANVKRISPDTSFNFSFLVDAFMSDQKKPDEKTKTDSTSTLKFSINKFSFKDIGITYKDDLAGNDVKIYLGDLNGKIKNFDLDNQHYVVQTVELKNTSLNYLQHKPLEQLVAHIAKSVDSGKVKPGKLPVIDIENLNLQAVNIQYNDQLSTTQADLLLNQLALQNIKVNLPGNAYSADKLSLIHSNIQFAFKTSTTSTLQTESKDTAATAPITLALKEIALSNNRIKFDNQQEKPIQKGMDFNHLLVSNLDLNSKNLTFDKNGINLEISNGKMNEKSGFQLKKLQGKIAYNNKFIKVNNFILETPNTKITNTTALSFNSLEDLTKHPENVKVQLEFKNSILGLKDASYFSTALPANYANLKLSVNTRISGYLNNLDIPTLQIAGLKSTKINLFGKVKGAPDTKKLFLDLKIKDFTTSRADILALAPKNTIPANISIPENLNLRGYFKGSLANFNTHLDLNSTYGNASIMGNLSGSKNKEKYNAQIAIKDFNVGKLLKQEPSLGKITLDAKIDGYGLDLKKANAQLSGTIKEAFYNQYTYKNINLKGKIQSQIFEITALSADEHLDFDLAASGNLAGKYPAIKTTIAIKQIDLQKLNFSTTEFKVAGNLRADLQTADINYLNGSVFATNLQVVKEGKRINLDTIQILAKTDANSSALRLKSEFITARIDGKYELANVATALINQINKYYQFGEIKKIPDQRLKFSLTILNPKVLKDFIPQLTTLAPTHINGLLDTQKDSLIVNGFLPQLIYGDYKIDSARISLSNSNNKLNYALNIQGVQSPSIQLFNSEISGNAFNNQLDLNIFLRDKLKKDRYALAGTFNSLNRDYKFSLNPQKLLLNYQQWVVSNENYIQFGKSGILANNFNLSRNDQLLRVNSIGSTPNSPLRVELKNFQIETLTSFAEADSTLVGGIISGTADVKDLTGDPKFEANLTVQKLRYLKDNLGDLRISVNNNTENAFEVNAALSGVHELRVNGFYYTKPSSSFDLKIDIPKIDLKAIESVSAGQIKQGTGTLSGQLTVKGSLDAPKVLGALKFNNAGFNIQYVNSYFRIPDEQIDFTNEGIRFNKFTLIDSLNKKATIDGMIYTSDFKNYRFGLDINTNNFRALHSTEKDNELIYGTVYLTSALKIRGTLNQPEVNGNITVNDGTKFFFALPADDPSVIEQDGIVQFIDEDAPPFNGTKALNVDSLTRSPMRGMNVSVSVEIDKNAELNIVIDPSNGDALRVKGQGNLNATIDPSGKTSLTGRYDLTDGAYNLSIGGLAKKEFKIQAGSFINWTGEATTADIDITALYEVNTAAIDLVADQVESMDASVRNTYKQKLPFQVYLYLKGELLKPVISFKIDLPENERGGTVGYAAYTKLQQVNSNESELNKQVFALLALKRFISDNPFQSLAGGTSTGSLARQSVSKFLTEQLNSVASDLIKGVDINLGINSSEDYSTGTLQNKTDLELDFSKKLLNDRLTVSVGSTFGLEGSRTANQNSSNIAGNINVEYLLSADGRYRLRFYRRNQTEAVVEGEIIETGVGFALVVEYNKFKEIFKRNRKNRTNDNKNKKSNQENKEQ